MAAEIGTGQKLVQRQTQCADEDVENEINRTLNRTLNSTDGSPARNQRMAALCCLDCALSFFSISAPLFRSGNQFGSQRVPLDVPADRQKVLIVLERKTIVIPLIQVAFRGCEIMSVIAHRVCGSHPA